MKLTLIGGGVVGRSFGSAFAAQGFDITGIWDAQPTPPLNNLAHDIHAKVYTAAGHWLSNADVVISAVFGSAALEVAEQAFQFMRPGTIYVDMTTADPDDMQRADLLAQRCGLRFVDVSITGAVNLHGAKTPLLCAGEAAEEVAHLFQQISSPIQVVGKQPGDAAALKLLRSIFTKGLEALAVECLMTAQQRGLREKVHQILSDIDKGSLRLTMESMVCTHIEHAARRQKEVFEAQRQMQLVGIPPVVTSAVEKLFERTANKLATHPYQGNNIDQALAWLTESTKA